ncbi:MAG: sensor histidine kinase [Lewinella sp.]|nr:sensor histidine kinase [Lewinella sp.]
MKRQLNIMHWGLHLAVWLVGALGFSLVFIRFLPLELTLLRTISNMLLMMALFYSNNWLVRQFYISKEFKVYFSWAALLLIVITFLRAWINYQFSDNYPTDRILQKNLSSLQVTATVSNLGIMFVGIIYELSVHRKAIETQALEATNKQQEAQLQFLRAQINPHFLFNTLNNIYSLAVVRSEQTAPMVLQLSDLLRYVIYESQKEKVPLSKEIRQIERFIELFQMRNETPLNIVFRYSGPVEEMNIEPMMLIPLVENCFKHCDFDTNEKAYTEVTLWAEANRLHFKTVNTKNDALRQKDQTGGVGLENIRKRLELKYPGKHQMAVKNELDRFTVNLELDISGQ